MSAAWQARGRRGAHDNVPAIERGQQLALGCVVCCSASRLICGERAADDDFTIALGGGDEDGAVDVGIVAVVGRGALAEEGRGGASKQEYTRADERAGAGAEKR